MIVYNGSLVLLNKNEWLQYISKILEINHTNSSNKLLREICNFDFKFKTISISQ